MDDERTEKWQAGARGFLEPDEPVLATAPGQKAERMWPILFLVDAIALPLLKRALASPVTDRNLYVCRVSSVRDRKVEEVLQKRRVGEARVDISPQSAHGRRRAPRNPHRPPRP